MATSQQLEVATMLRWLVGVGTGAEDVVAASYYEQEATKLGEKSD